MTRSTGRKATGEESGGQRSGAAGGKLRAKGKSRHRPRGAGERQGAKADSERGKPTRSKGAAPRRRDQERGEGARRRSQSPREDLPGLARRLTEALRRRAQRATGGSVSLEGRLPLALDVPLTSDADTLEAFASQLEQSLDLAVRAFADEQRLSSTAGAFCLRCEQSDCEHAQGAPNEVFVGYTATGLPEFRQYGQALLDLGDPRAAQLFGGSGPVTTRTWSAEELTNRLVPALAEAQSVELLGQVTAGWFWVSEDALGRDRAAEGRNYAISLQVVAVHQPGQPRRLTLRTIATSPLGGSLEELGDFGGELPWAAAQRWCRTALADVERGMKRKKAAVDWRARVQRILAGLERRLVRQERSQRRRTRHAETRRKQQRPTGHALADLAAVSDTEILQDSRNGALVVLGERGRTHFFNQQGRLVTSIVYGADAVARRRKSGRWVSSDPESVQLLRAAINEQARALQVAPGAASGSHPAP